MSHIAALNTEWVKRSVESCKETLENREVEFDTIAFAGMSGALFAPFLAVAMKKELLLVRKVGDTTHSLDTCEYAFRATISRILIVDDFVCSGGTIQRIGAEIRKWRPRARVVGVLEYNHGLSGGFEPGREVLAIPGSDGYAKPAHLKVFQEFEEHYEYLRSLGEIRNT
jgi:hypoxanthine phosphoribosyltransferase